MCFVKTTSAEYIIVCLNLGEGLGTVDVNYPDPVLPFWVQLYVIHYLVIL